MFLVDKYPPYEINKGCNAGHNKIYGFRYYCLPSNSIAIGDHSSVRLWVSTGETKMWAAVRENGDFLHLQFE